MLSGTPNNRALLVDPSYAEAYNNLGTAHAELGHVKEATRNLERAINLKPSLAVARYNLGVVSLRANERQTALQQYRLLTSLNAQLADKLYSGIYQDRVLSLAK